MFVRQAKYDAAVRESFKLLLSLRQWQDACEERTLELNKIVRRINDLGGENFLQNATLNPAPKFTADDLQRLIQLVHPDKHDGKQMAVEMTQKLIAMKEKMK